MKVLIVTTQDRFFLSHIKERALYFKKKGCFVGVAAQKTSDSFVTEIHSLGFFFFDTKIERKSINPFSQFLALCRLYTILKRFKPNICFHLGAKAIFYGTFVARLYNSKIGIINAPIGLGYVYSSNSLKATLLRPLVSHLYKKFLAPKHSRVIIENPDDLSYFVRKKYIDPKRSFCIPGAGVDTSVFHPLPFTERNSTCTILMASRLIKEKGVLDFLKLADLVRQHDIPVRMQLLGTPDFGNPSSLTPSELEALKKNPNIEYFGFQKDVHKFLQRAHICCLPSYYREGLPRVLVEATSCGLAILTTDSVGCREVIKENNGFLFQPHDVDRLFQLVLFLSNHPKKLQEMAKNSRKIAVTYFDTEIISSKTYEVLSDLISECDRLMKSK